MYQNWLKYKGCIYVHIKLWTIFAQISKTYFPVARWSLYFIWSRSWWTTAFQAVVFTIPSSSHQSQTLQSYSVRSTFRIMYRDGVWFRDSPFIPYILIGDSPPHVSSYPGPCCELNRILNKKKMKLLNIRNFAKRSQTYQTPWGILLTYSTFS